jgi:uncharacterized protein (DUF4213/DUF364 family)
MDRTAKKEDEKIQTIAVLGKALDRLRSISMQFFFFTKEELIILTKIHTAQETKKITIRSS